MYHIICISGHHYISMIRVRLDHVKYQLNNDMKENYSTMSNRNEENIEL